MKNNFIIVILFLTVSDVCAQEKKVEDSAAYQSLDEVMVTGFELNRRQQLSTAAVRTVRVNVAEFFSKTSLVNAFNTVAGVRMEERSPGSYRLNIRGSSVRSPFGVRNVKVYWNEIPITDPGGNTYFNQFAYNNWSSIQVFKGPAGSMYGAGTGGLVLMQSLDNPWKRGAGIEYTRGSYGLNNVFVHARTGVRDNRNLITYAHNETDGYRVQSAMRRDNFSWTSLIRISDRQEIRTNLLFTDMYYQTPGGLTKSEFTADPKAARPAAGILPGAVQAKAAIYQKNLLAGIQHRYKLDTHWSNATSLYVAYANIKNPAVRNYERRSEPHAGGRTVFSWENKTTSTVLKFTGGSELQHGFFNTKVFGNRQGVSDTLQTDDEIDYNVYSVFVQGDIAINDKWFITAGTSLNNTKVSITRLNKLPVTKQPRTYRQEWSPRISLLRSFKNYTSVFAIVSKGFSPQSIGELLPSTGNISTQLEAETGWNYELGIRNGFRVGKNRIFTEVAAYYFRLTNTLVQRRDNSGA
ncbi:MAG TPA: TonB-dependent receptor, partial [Chitinophagaceae bacterium]